MDGGEKLEQALKENNLTDSGLTDKS